MLKEPFPSQQTQMVADPSQSPSSFGSQVFMAGTIPVHVSTRAKDYPSNAGKEPEVPSSAPPSSSGPLHIERPSVETIPRPPPKGVLRKSSYNPNARAAQHYSIVEDLAQAPSAMSALEVLQSCPSQRKSLLSAIGGIDPADSELISFDLEGLRRDCLTKLLSLYRSSSIAKRFTVQLLMKAPQPASCLLLAGKPLVPLR